MNELSELHISAVERAMVMFVDAGEVSGYAYEKAVESAYEDFKLSPNLKNGEEVVRLVARCINRSADRFPAAQQAVAKYRSLGVR